MREIEFRGRNKRTGKWVYGNLIIKKTKKRIEELDKPVYDYKYSIQYMNKNGKYSTCEVTEESIGQYVGTGQYGRIYEEMSLYDEYADENCFIQWDEEYCGFRLIYDNVSEQIEGLDGLMAVDAVDVVKGADNIE